MDESSHLAINSSDEAIIGTNDDATCCKHSAMKLGYFKDDFVSYLTKNHDRFPPLINRGYYSRVAIFRRVIETFIANGGKQIISLGAGFDTNYFHFHAMLPVDFKYLELDFQQVTLLKTSTVRRQRRFASLLTEPHFTEDGTITSRNYCLRHVDLRDLPTTGNTILQVVDKSRPTLFLSECVLIYMTVEESANIIGWISSQFTSAGFILYEQILPHDGFGQTMQKNLSARGCPLLSLLAYPTLQDQIERFTSRGWTHVDAYDMLQVWDLLLDPNDTHRVEKLELFDELEEWRLIQSHYCFVLASLYNKNAENAAERETGAELWEKLTFESLNASRPAFSPPAGLGNIRAAPPSSKFFD